MVAIAGGILLYATGQSAIAMLIFIAGTFLGFIFYSSNVFALRKNSAPLIICLPEQKSERYPEDVEEDEDTDAGYSSDSTDKNRCKVVAEIGFSHPLHDMEEVQDDKKYQADNCISDDNRELFDQIVQYSNNSHNKEKSDDD